MAIEILRPIDDNYVEFDRSTGSYNFACIDEASKNESDYVYAGEYMFDEYIFASPVDIQPDDNINSATVYAYAKRSAGDLKITLGLSGAFVGEFDLTTTYTLYSKVFTDITYSDLESGILAGFSTSISGSGTIYVCQAWVEVDYTVAGAGCPRQMMHLMRVMT